jgi:hypothetical protein
MSAAMGMQSNPKAAGEQHIARSQIDNKHPHDERRIMSWSCFKISLVLTMTDLIQAK